MRLQKGFPTKVIIFVAACLILSGCSERQQNVSPLHPDDYAPVSEAAEDMLQHATANVVKKNYFPFGQIQKTKNGVTAYELLCRVKNIYPELEYYALVSVWADDSGVHMIEGAQVADIHDEQYRVLYDARRSQKTIYEYNMVEILESQELIDAYKKVYPYLCDLIFNDTDDSTLLCQAGYSWIWQVLGVRYREDDSTVLFEDVSYGEWYAFSQAEDKDAYFQIRILPQYSVIDTPDQTDLSEYVMVKKGGGG